MFELLRLKSTTFEQYYLPKFLNITCLVSKGYQAKIIAKSF